MRDERSTVQRFAGFGFLLGSIVLLLVGCATIKNVAQIKPPTLQVEGMRFTGLDFETVDLAFDVKMTNPNAVAVNLAGFDYDLRVAEGSLLQGRQQKPTEIAAYGDSDLEVPLTLRFADVYAAFSYLAGVGSAPYDLDLGLSFNLPVLGATRVPISHSGELPMIKIPRVALGGLRVKELDFSGADLELGLEVDNPNTFGVALNRLTYALDVSGRTWAQGEEIDPMAVSAAGKSVLGIPIRLDFSEMGSSLFSLLMSSDSLDYELRGDMDLQPDLPGLPGGSLNLDRVGVLEVLR